MFVSTFKKACFAGLLTAVSGSFAQASNPVHVPCYAGGRVELASAPSVVVVPYRTHELKDDGLARDWCHQAKRRDASPEMDPRPEQVLQAEELVSVSQQ